jgi:hypothetical protein
MKLPRTRNRWMERLLIDDAYLEWRDESAEVWHAYKRWNGAPAREAHRTFWTYRAALEREEHAARVYERLVIRLEAAARERAETRRRSHLGRRSRDGVLGSHHRPRADELHARRLSTSRPAPAPG